MDSFPTIHLFFFNTFKTLKLTSLLLITQQFSSLKAHKYIFKNSSLLYCTYLLSSPHLGLQKYFSTRHSYKPRGHRGENTLVKENKGVRRLDEIHVNKNECNTEEDLTSPLSA